MYKRIRIFIKNNHFLHNQVNFFLVIVLLLLNILVWILWVFKIQNLGYTVYVPVELPFESLRYYTLPIVGSFFSLVNVFLAYYSSKREVLISFYLLSGGILIEILILVLIRHYLMVAG